MTGRQMNPTTWSSLLSRLSTSHISAAALAHLVVSFGRGIHSRAMREAILFCSLVTLPLESLEKDVRGLGGREDRFTASALSLQVLQDRSEAGRQNCCSLAVLVSKTRCHSLKRRNQFWSGATQGAEVERSVLLLFTPPIPLHPLPSRKGGRRLLYLRERIQY
jgi:hypothetical protein